MTNITLEINGESREVPAVTSARELMRFLGLDEGRVALEINHQIIRRADWDTTPVLSGDHVEIVQFVGGG